MPVPQVIGDSRLADAFSCYPRVVSVHVRVEYVCVPRNYSQT